MRRRNSFGFSALIVLAMVSALIAGGVGAPRPAGAMVTPDPAGVVPVTPCVVLDSAAGVGGFAGPYIGGQEVDIEVTGTIPSAQGGATNCGVPQDAPGVVLDITAVSPSRAGNLRAYPTGDAGTGGVVNFAPLTPQLNNSNAVIIPVSALGKISVFVNAGTAGLGLSTTQVELTVIGYLDEAGGQLYTPVTPCAFADSRPGEGASASFTGPYVGNAEMTVRLTGSYGVLQGGGAYSCDVPLGADGALVNLVALNAVGSGRVGLRPSDQSTPTTYVSYSQLSPAANNSNAVFVPLPANGELDLFTIAGPSDSVNVRAVVLGYLQSGDGDSYVPVTPCAAFDSRSMQGEGGAQDGFVGPFNGDQSVTYQIAGTHSIDQGGGTTDCGVPPQATAVFMNLVALNPTRFGNLRAYGTGTNPSGGVVNFAYLPMNNSNAIAVPLSFSGQIDIAINGGPTGIGLQTANVRGIVLGYFIDANPTLEVEITGPRSYEPPDNLPTTSPITITGFASDDVGVDRVELIIVDVLFGGRMYEAGVGQFFFQYQGAASRVDATLASQGATGTPFSFGPIDFESSAIGGSGHYQITAYVFDAVGNQATSEVFNIFTVAPSPPTVTLEAPLNGAVVSDVVTLYGSARDENGIEAVRVFVKDANSGQFLVNVGGALGWQTGSTFLVACQLGCSSTGTWSLQLDGPSMQGRTITVEAISVTDWGGSVHNEYPGWSYTIVFDTAPPTIDISVPVSGQVLRAPVDVFGTAFDPSGVAAVELALYDSGVGGFWNGTGWAGAATWWPANVTHNGWANVSWSYNWGSITNFGTNNNFQLHARSVDAAGNTSAPELASFIVGSDLIAPTVTIATPSNGATATDPTMISGTAADPTSGVTLVSAQVKDTVTGMYWDGSGWTSLVSTMAATLDNPYHPTTNWSLQVFSPNDGTGSGSYEVTAFANDGFSNVGSVISTFTIDNSDPTVTVGAPTPNFVYSTEPIFLSGGVSDTAALGTTVELRIHEDKVGGRYWTGSAWSATSALISVPLASPGATSSTWTYSTSLPGGVGPYQVDATVYDAAGNSGQISWVDFAVDQAPPTIDIGEPDPGDAKVDPVTFTGTAGDDIGLASVELAILDQVSGLYFTGSGYQAIITWLPANLNGTNWSLSGVPLDGNGGNWSYRVSARATDTFAKTTTTTPVDFTTIDPTPPDSPVIVNPADDAIVTNPVVISGTATDNRVVDSVQLEIKEDLNCGNRYWNGTGWQVSPTTYAAAISSGTGTGSVSWTSSPNLGSYNGDCGRLQIRAFAYDVEGNVSAYTQVRFATDVADPTVTLVNPADGSVSVGGVFVSGTWADDVTSPMPAVTYEVRDVATDLYWDGTDWVSPQKFLSASVNPAGAWTSSLGSALSVNGSGHYKLTAYVTDSVGRTDSDGPHAFYYLPTAAGTSIDSPATVTSRPMTLSGSAHDEDGVDFVEIAIRERSIAGSFTRSWTGTSWTASTALQYFTVPTTGNPYTVDWSYVFQPGEASTGEYELRVRRIDDLGNVPTAATQVIQYVPPVLQVAVQDPADGATVPAGNVLFGGRAISDISVTIEIRIQNQAGQWLNSVGGWQGVLTPLDTSEVYQGTGDWDWSTTLGGSFTPGAKYEVSVRAITTSSPGAWSSPHVFTYS